MRHSQITPAETLSHHNSNNGNNNNSNNNNATMTASRPTVTFQQLSDHALDKEYKRRLQQFLNFLLINDIKQKNLEQYEELILLHLNDLEIFLLVILRQEIQKISGADYIMTDRIISYLTEANFLKEFRDTFKIRREPEFVYNLMDVLFPQIREILRNIDANEVSNIFPSTAIPHLTPETAVTPYAVARAAFVGRLASVTDIPSSYMLYSFYHFIESSVSRVVEKMRNSSVTQWPALFASILPEKAEAIKDYLLENYLSEEKFPATWEALHNAIKYRYDKRENLLKRLERKSETADSKMLTTVAKSIDQVQADAHVLWNSTRALLLDGTLDAALQPLLQEMAVDYEAACNISTMNDLFPDDDSHEVQSSVASNLMLKKEVEAKELMELKKERETLAMQQRNLELLLQEVANQRAMLSSLSNVPILEMGAMNQRRSVSNSSSQTDNALSIVNNTLGIKKT